MDGFQPLQFIFDSEFLFFQGCHPGFVPIGVPHFGGDDFFQFLVLNREILDLSFRFHAFTSRVRARKLKHQGASLSPLKVLEPEPLSGWPRGM